MNVYYFRRDKTAVLGSIKAQLPFSVGKYQLLNSWNEISFPTIFYVLKFVLPHSNRSSYVSSHNYPFKGHKTISESRKLHFKPFSYSFSLGASELPSIKQIFTETSRLVPLFFSADGRLSPISLSNYKNNHLHRGIIILLVPQLIPGKLIWLKIKFDRLKLVSSLNISCFDATENSQCKSKCSVSCIVTKTCLVKVGRWSSRAEYMQQFDRI